MMGVIPITEGPPDSIRNCGSGRNYPMEFVLYSLHLMVKAVIPETLMWWWIIAGMSTMS